MGNAVSSEEICRGKVSFVLYAPEGVEVNKHLRSKQQLIVMNYVNLAGYLVSDLDGTISGTKWPSAK